MFILWIFEHFSTKEALEIYNQVWEDTKTVIYIFNKYISHISNLYRQF